MNVNKRGKFYESFEGETYGLAFVYEYGKKTGKIFRTQFQYADECELGTKEYALLMDYIQDEERRGFVNTIETESISYGFGERVPMNQIVKMPK